MSDANSGDESSKRPGMNANGAGVEGDNPLGNQSKKRSRRRWRKRQKRSEDGIRADKTQEASPTARENEQPRSADGADRRTAPANSQVHSSAESGSGSKDLDQRSGNKKRRRRRRGRGGGNRTQNGEQSAAATANAGPEVTAGNADAAAVTVAAVAAADTGAKVGKRRKRRRGSAGGGQQTDRNQPQNTRNQTNGKSTGKSTGRPSRNWGDAYAALDLGTNNCRLLVAVPQQPGRFKVVDAFSRIVRLGEGLAATGQLREEAMERAIGALKQCAAKLENRKVKGVRLIATEACRRATNGAEFLQRVEKETGIKLEIIDRETEARLAVAGCSSLVDRKAKGVVLFDIGGGSSELALLDLDKRNRHDLGPAMVSWTSLPLGVVTLSEKHGGGRVVTRSVFENMVADVSELLSDFEGREALKSVSERGEVHLLGTSGTVTTLAGIHLNLPRYDRRRVDGIWMDSADVDEMINRLVDMTFEQRAANPCIGYDRADLVLAGCAILVAIQQLWPCPRLRVADRGLREGLLTEMMNADNAWQRRTRYYRSNRAQ
ncbi:MAG: Ppx/GppA phosphatase family protein [Rhizobiaceae bacterium]